MIFNCKSSSSPDCDCVQSITVEKWTHFLNSNYLRTIAHLSRAKARTINLFSLETSTFEELGSEFINFACNCVINTLRLIVYLTGFSI